MARVGIDARESVTDHLRCIIEQFSSIRIFTVVVPSARRPSRDSRAAVRRRGGPGRLVARVRLTSSHYFENTRRNTSVRSTGFGPAPGAGTPAVSDARSRALVRGAVDRGTAILKNGSCGE